jgi:ATP-dependent RNA helicase DDX59
VFGKGLPFKTALVVGGDALPQQVYRLKQGVELIVGTPGRLVDLLTKHPIDLGDVCILVLDEVDTMLERGFREEVTQIVQALSGPQLMLFSATIPASIEKLASSLLRRGVEVSVGGSGPPGCDSIAACGAVKQTVIWVESNKKKAKLFDILKSAVHYRPPMVVFVGSRVGADMLAEAIYHTTGIRADAFHGKKEMAERRRVLSSFLMGELPIVVATGVLGRGLDLVKVKQVVVFDMPESLEEYVHQIGRASRLGMPGSAIVFINDESKGLLRSFVGLLRSSGALIPKELSNSPYVHSSFAAAYHHQKRRKKR